jgi:thiamine-monophosphate kinase
MGSKATTELASSDLTELGVIRRITDRLSGMVEQKGLRVLLGQGDDAAVVRLGPSDGAQRLNISDTVLTTDLLVEGVHFDLRYMSLADAAYKAMVVSLSDCAAMGARPTLALGQLGVPSGISEEQIDLVIEGVRSAQEACLAACGESVALIGGDTVAAPQWILGFTLLGELRGSPLTRKGARPGDQLWASSGLGLSQLGLHVLWDSAARRPAFERADFPGAVTAHLRPRPQLELGLWLQREGLASACLDLSDSLSQSALLLAEASGVGIQLDFSRLQLPAELGLFFDRLAAQPKPRRRSSKSETPPLPLEPEPAAVPNPTAFTIPRQACPGGQELPFGSQADFLLSSAEDYELLFTAPASATARLLRESPVPLLHLGSVLPATEGHIYKDERGRISALRVSGFQHF